MNSIFKSAVIDGCQYSIINLKELKDYRKIKKRFNNKAVILLKYISTFCKSAYAGKTPSKSDIANFIFDNQSTSQKKLVICAAYLMKEYVDGYLLTEMTKSNYARFKQKIDYLCINFEELAYFVEKEVFKIPVGRWYQTSGFGRRALSQTDIIFAVNSLMYIELVKDIKDMWNSDLVPGAIMYLRLYIDNSFKKYIPYTKIIDASGKEISRTGLRRDFIKKQYSSNSSNLSNKEEALLLVTIYKWCCDSVHYGALEDEYWADWALTNIKKVKTLFIDITTMKRDFESFVTGTVKNASSVQW